jgi:small subunit ribosomal protein S20
MPHTASAAKRKRQSDKRNARNRLVKKTIKKTVGDARTAIAGGDTAKTTEAILLAAKKLDKAAAHKNIHKNKASRLKSRLAKARNKAAKAA